jgi:hypothetical protein
MCQQLWTFSVIENILVSHYSKPMWICLTQHTCFLWYLYVTPALTSKYSAFWPHRTRSCILTAEARVQSLVTSCEIRVTSFGFIFQITVQPLLHTYLTSVSEAWTLTTYYIITSFAFKFVASSLTRHSADYKVRKLLYLQLPYDSHNKSGYFPSKSPIT